MSSLICEAGSVSDYDFILQDRSPRDSQTNHGNFQVSRYLNEPWDYRSLSIDLGPEGGRRLLCRRYSSQQLLTRTIAASQVVQHPVSDTAVLRSGTLSSIDSEDSHYSVPESRIIVQAYENNYTGLFHEPDSESDENEDVFESLNSAIIEVLAPDLRLAAGVITHLYQLPAHLRSFVYGFTGHTEYDAPHFDYEADARPSLSTPAQSSDGHVRRKRKDRPSGDDHLSQDIAKPKKSRAKCYTKAIVDKLKYACPFNIYDPKRYCVRNERGGTGDHYSSCMGPGYSDPRHLKEHFSSTHRLSQCQRCWQKFDYPEQLSYHRDKMEPRCEKRTHLIHLKEGITEIEWDKIQRALAVPRTRKDKGVVRTNETDRWFAVWKILFPPETYPNLQVPSHPYYVDPEMFNNPLPTYSETERTIEIVKAIWDKKVEDARAEGPDATYQPSQEDVCNIIREAASITKRSTQLPEFVSPPPPASQTNDFIYEGAGAPELDHSGDTPPSAGYDQINDIDHFGYGPEAGTSGLVTPVRVEEMDHYGTNYYPGNAPQEDWSKFVPDSPQDAALFESLLQDD